jgi:hypothetical protein
MLKILSFRIGTVHNIRPNGGNVNDRFKGNVDKTENKK